MKVPIGFLLLPSLLMAGCAAKAIPDAIYQDSKNVVRVEARPQDSHLTPKDDFQHPLKLSEEELTILLQSIRVEEPRNLISILKSTPPRSLQAFSEDEARKMAGPLTTALGRAQPNERVVFLFTHPHGRLFEGVTSGVLFAKADRLHLILGRYRASSRPHEKDIALTAPVLPSPPYLGFRLAAGPYQALVDLDESPVWKEPTGFGHWVMMDYQQLLAHPPEPAPLPTVKEPPSTVEPKEIPATLKEKLRLLKELREENLITEEEYNQKRQELLKGF